MKFIARVVAREILKSLPVRGAWIEIALGRPICGLIVSLPVRGAWIEIAPHQRSDPYGRRRSPCGERGLKSASTILPLRPLMSLPVRGAWIEIHEVFPV